MSKRNTPLPRESFSPPLPHDSNRRQMTGADNYRYAFQGQEKDPETGKEAFELRLWDSRIGRWLTTDPAGQYHNPYLGMGNNPVNGIDIGIFGNKHSNPRGFLFYGILR